jgi:plastocyanin
LKKLIRILLLVSLPAVFAPVSAFAKAAKHTVVIENMVYTPAELTVNKGDTVVWVNKDFFPHTVTAENSSYNSKDIAAGKSWKYVVKRSGDSKYKCSYHPTMHGRLIVK